MYPFIRTFTKMAAALRAEPLTVDGTDRLTIRVLPHDLDGFLELNNGRAITLYDIGRFTLALRTGLLREVRRNNWAFAVAGSFVRYRRRVTLFQKLEIRTRVVGRNGRFILMEQAMWRGDTCTSHMLIRTAVTSKNGVVDPSEVLKALNLPEDSFAEVPDWEAAMIAAEDTRPWPPEF